MKQRFGSPGRWSLLLLSVAGCAPAPHADWVTPLLADPMFGSGATVVSRLRHDPRVGLRGDAAQLEARLAALCAEHDELAAAMVTELVPPALAAAVTQFLGTPAGGAMMRADLVLATTNQASIVLDDAVTAYCDPATVGAAARARFADVSAAHARGGVSVSPTRLAVVIAAMTIEPHHCEGIAAFVRGEAGRRWLELRKAALPRVRPRFAAAWSALADAGHAAAPESLPDLVLPRAEFAPDDATKAPAGR